MNAWFWLTALTILSYGCSGLLCRLAPGWGLVDIPNQRSAHTTARPRGGGLAFVACFALAVAGLVWQQWVPMRPAVVIIAGGGAMALLGLLDDLYSLSVRVRLPAQLIIASLSLWALPALPDFAWWGVALPWPLEYLLVLLGLVWLCNLVNFVDGIDGIATLQALAVLLPMGGFMLLIDATVWLPVIAVLAAVLLGFLPWNWQRAHIFMGDVGSGFLGFTLGLLMLVSSSDSKLSPWLWLVLLGVALADTGVSLLRRALRGENLATPHASHAYQTLARRWGSHRQVCYLLVAIVAVWLLPMAFLVQQSAGSTAFMLLWLALLPLLTGCYLVGAGRADGP